MLDAWLLGFGTFAALEVLAFTLRRYARNFQGSVLLQVTAVAAGLWAGLLQSPWAKTDATSWKIFCTGLVVLLALTVFSLFDSFVLRRPWAPARGPLVPGLVRDVIRLLLALLVGFVAATQINDLPMPAVLASSTVISAVLALALQDVLKNIFAGMAIQIEGWLKVGDWLSIDGTPARVIEMSWRSTRLRTSEGVEFLEPNVKVAEVRLVNYGEGREPVAFPFHVSLAYETPPAQAKEALCRAARRAPGVAFQPPPIAMVREYGDSGVHYEVRVWTHQVHAIAAFRDAVYSRIWYEVQRAGLSIPYPVRTVHLRDLDRAEAAREQAQDERAAALLGRIELFAKLKPATLLALARAARKLHYEHGEQLVREGEPGDSLYVIDSGTVSVSKAEAGAGKVQLATLHEGSFFGEHSLLTGEPRSATVSADASCEVWVLEKGALAPLLVSDPTLAESLSQALAVRDAATLAVLARSKEQQRNLGPAPDHESILGRIRAFFRLP